MTLFASATLLGRDACPWPMLLNGTAPKGEQSGYDRTFDFTLGPVSERMCLRVENGLLFGCLHGLSMWMDLRRPSL